MCKTILRQNKNSPVGAIFEVIAKSFEKLEYVK